MRARLLVVILLAAGLALMTGCGGAGITSSPTFPSASQPNATGAGSVVVFGGDAPACNIMSFAVTITDMQLIPEGGGAAVSLISAANPVTVDFASLMGTATPLHLGTVPPGSYSKVTITMANAGLGVLAGSGTTMGPQMMNTVMGSSTVSTVLNPPLQVADGGNGGLSLDFDLLRSLLVDANGQLTGAVNPVVHANVMTGTSSGMMGETDDLHGIVQTVTTTSTDPTFQGSFALERGMMGVTFTVNVTSATTFDSGSGLSSLSPGAFVELDAYVDDKNNLVAKTVSVGEATNMAQQMGAFDGVVTSVTRDSSGNALQCTLAVRDEYPDMHSSVPMMSAMTVAILAGTHFRLPHQNENLANMPFDPTTLAVGQSVTVSGQARMGSMMSGGTSIAAVSITMHPQAMLGNFSQLISAGSDAKTGGFQMMPCSTQFAQSMPVLTFAPTDFGSGANLSTLQPQPILLMRGLLFYQQSPMASAGVSIHPPSWVLVATQVRPVP